MPGSPDKPSLSIVQTQIGLNQPALDEWIEYRREDSKKPMSQRAVDKVVKKLLQWSEEDQQRIVDHAIEHEWQGLYWVDPPREVNSAHNRSGGNTGAAGSRLTPAERVARKRAEAERADVGTMAAHGRDVRPPVVLPAGRRAE